VQDATNGKMTDNRINNGLPRPFNLFSEPFHVLCIEPGATTQQILLAFDRALEKQVVSADALIFARDVVLDPARRLPHELGYPIDSATADVEAIYSALTRDGSLDERVEFSSRLPPLSRANFLGHVAASQPATGRLLSALLDAHASVEPAEIFDILKGLRASAGYVAPSLVSVNQGLIELYQNHAQAAIARYERIQEAADPVLACTQQTLAHGGRHHIEALERLLAAYRHSIAAQQSAANQGIETACEVLLRQPSDGIDLDSLKAALLAWMSICRPLVLWSAYQGSDEPDFKLPVDQVHGVIASLADQKHEVIALDLAEYSRNVFHLMPQAVEQFDDDVRLTADLISKAQVPPLQVASKPWIKPGRLALLFGMTSTATLLAVGGYLGFQMLWPPASPGTAPAPVPERSEPEIMPLVGAGQRLELGGVRYCKFQEARLLMIKPEVHGAEDASRYNELVNDYNSRCSDFYYRDADIATVEAEMAQNSSRLAAEAKRLVSAWPGHSFSSVPPAK
jgi:hypothetical protein